jgi:hypothetical protein
VLELAFVLGAVGKDEIMGGTSFGLIGGTRVEGATKISGTYWHVSVLGSSRLDLRQADFPTDQPVRINILSILGGGRIRVPRGTRVEIGGFHILGSKRQDVDRAEEEVTNHLKVNLFCLVGSIRITS